MRGEEIAYLGENEGGEYGVHYASVLTYPDGCPLVTERPVSVDRVLLRPRSMAGFIGGIAWVDALTERGYHSDDMDLILPFVPGARQDRLNDEGDYLFTAKTVAAIINRLGLRVTVVDPHSDVVAALIDHCEVIRPAEILRTFPLGKAYAAVVAPDAGAEKRAGGVAKELGVPLIHAWKNRDLTTGRITGYGLARNGAPDGRVLVVDDICDGGATFMALHASLSAIYPQADLYVTHGLFTRGTRDLLDRYDEVICTDSVVVDRPGTKVIKFCESLLND